jgi:murein DD-endopeptidase MepM/ murein hydrolase activator NlpD
MRHLILGVLVTLFCLPMPVQALTLKGHLVQGGMAIGHVDPATSVYFHGKPVQVSPDGIFVIGFSRDAKADSEIELHPPSGKIETRPIHIKKRSYKIQRINGLPANKVTPSAEELVRIRKENALVKKAREIDAPRTDFTESFIWPVTGRISGVYGSQRILNGKPRRPHFGVDIAVPTGTKVKAPADGIVSLALDNMFFSGGTLIIDHGHGVSTSYQHLHKILVKAGQRVHQGEIIALSGATGRVTGPHLHWGMNWFETRLDPSLVVPPMPKRATSKK